MPSCGVSSEHACSSCERSNHVLRRDVLHDLDQSSGWHPYVGHEWYFDTPFNAFEAQNWHYIEYGVDTDNAQAFSLHSGSFTGMEAAHGEAAHGRAADKLELQEVNDASPHPKDSSLGNTSDPGKLEDSMPGTPTAECMDNKSNWSHEESWAPGWTSSERLGTPRPASSGTWPTLKGPDSKEQCALLGGGKRGASPTSIWEDEQSPPEQTTPGHLQDRLMVLQQKAAEAIQALPAQRRDDNAFGQVETRIWGLEALKHVLKMRMALQDSLPLTRPVFHEPEAPPANELMAANLTLNIGNRGNRCYANTVLRLWCWMGAHHQNPKEFWGPSTKLCLQMLQQDVIEDIFWASELQPAIARLENPQNQHDAFEFLVHLWELWGQTGLQGNWHAHFGGRDHEFDTIPLFVRMPVEAGDGANFEQILADWANEGNGQCLANNVEHIVFHVGRYYWTPTTKEWVKHHNRLRTPTSFQVPQKTLTGHAGHATFVLRGIIAHQGEHLMSGNYIAMLVDGEAMWLVDDGECPQVQKTVPDSIQRGAVMIWASRAEQNSFWTQRIGSFEPPAKRQRTYAGNIEVFYGNVTQWNKEVKEWLNQQDIQIAMLVETHVVGKKLEAAASEMARSRWRMEQLDAHETGRGGTSGGQFFCAREGQATYRIDQFDQDGNGFLANVLQRQKWEVVLVSIYLKCGEDLNSATNAKILGELAAFLGELAVPWLVIGDFQVPPEQWQGHQLLNVLKAEVIHTGQPTLITGGEIDYVLASRTVSPFVDIKLNWDVPWRPHAGLVVTIDSTAPSLHLPQVTQYAAVPKLQSSSKQWEDFDTVTKPYWLGRTIGPKETRCAEWCHRAEQYALQHLHEPKFGRGSYLALELKPLPTTRALTPWRKGDLAYWGQFCSLLCHIEQRGSIGPTVMMRLKAKAADLDLRWQNVHGDTAFKEALEDLLSDRSRPLTLLIKGAEANQDYAKKTAMQRQSQDYQAWLSQASLRGHSGIYKCLKAPDAVHVRPFRNVPFQDRQQLREQQWYGRWQVIPQPRTSGERERLRWEGIVQARTWEDIDPHEVMKKFAKLPQKQVALMASAMHCSKTCRWRV